MNTFDSILFGTSPELGAVKRSAAMIAATDVPVLILGESGTGKELIATAIHKESSRRAQPFITVNCAALPENLVESELFGHRKGSFSGAVNDHPGRIRAADGGTVLLDEIGELPLAMQAKLLRFLEYGECQAVGEERPISVDVRILAATNRDLRKEVGAGRFREDLYYRLNIVPVELPPLRQRMGDIEILLKRFTQAFSQEHGLPAPDYADDALALLREYPWPGNVRELRNFCERMTILLAGQQINACQLPAEMRRQEENSGLAATIRLPDAGVFLGEVERNLIRQALEKTAGNKSRAARLLGLTRDTLNYRIRKYSI